MATADGLKLVAGLVIDTEIGPQFVCGGLVDMGEDKGSKFVPGQVGEVVPQSSSSSCFLQMLGGTKKDPVLFIPGQMGEIMEKQVLCCGRLDGPQSYPMI